MKPEKYRKIIDNLPDAFAYHQIVTDSHGNPMDYIILDVNCSFENITGLSKEMVMGKKITEIIPDIRDSSFDWIGVYGKVALTGEAVSFENYFEPLDRWFKGSAYSDEVGYFITVFHDISKRKNIVASLRKSEERLRLMARNSRDIVHETDTNGIFTYISPSRLHILGRGQELMGCPSFEYIHPEDIDGVIKTFQQVVATGGEKKGEYRYLHPQKGYVWLESFGNTYTNIYNETVVLVTTRDITDRKRAEEAMRGSEERFRAIFENAPVLIDAFDEKGRYTLWNSACQEKFGWSIDEINSHPSPLALFYPDPEVRQQILETVVTKPDGVFRERLPRTRKGEVVVSMWTNYRLPDGTVMNIGYDITERKQAEESLKFQLQFEKMVADTSSYFVNLPAQRLDDGINYALKAAAEFFLVDRSYLFQFSNQGKTMSNTHEWCAEGIEPQRDNFQDTPVESLSWWAKQIRTRDYVYIPDVDKLPPEAGAEKTLFQSQGIRSLLCLPIMKNGILMGFFGFDAVKKKKTWTDYHIVLLNVLDKLITSALIKHQADETIRYLSFHDSLTGLYNRAYLEEEMKRLDTTRQLPLAVIMADLNGLKLVNDTYGHEKGDEMLKAAAGILRMSCREEDIIARWGGDEFVMLLPQTTEKAGKLICKRIKDKCRQVHVNDVPISIALGVATKSSIGENLAETMKEAEDSMYEQKLTESRSEKSVLINTLLKALAEKSFETEAHTRRMQKVTLKIGEKMDFSDQELSRLSLLTTMHDIGKISIPEEILMQKEPLTSEEWEIVKKHPGTGYRIARTTSEFAHVAEDILCHHERWDGMGYPQGLKGEEIPLLARIAAVADAYEVMLHGRPYKKAMTRSEIVAEFKRCAGTHFDPGLVDIFLSILENECELDC